MVSGANAFEISDFQEDEIEGTLARRSECNNVTLVEKRLNGVFGSHRENYDGKTLSVKQSVWGKHTTDPKTASAKKPVPVIQPLRELLAKLREAEGNPANGPILRGLKLSKDGKRSRLT
jgi:hypothetical protein